MHTRELIDRMRAMEADHDPDGWPAVQMKDISALCDAAQECGAGAGCCYQAAEIERLRGEIERRHGIGGELIAARRERDELRELLIQIGAEKVEWLEGPHPTRHYSVDDLKQIKQTYTAKTRELLKAEK